MTKLLSPDHGELKPALKWAGGKRWLVPLLAPLWQRHQRRRLVEPFCGGLAVPLGLRPQRALLTDVNPHLINFYRWLQQGLTITLDLANDAESYYAHRERFNHLVRTGCQYSQEAACLFYYLNRTGYNGLCRFNRKGEFNVPIGRYDHINYTRNFSDYVPILSAWVFAVCEFDMVPIAEDDFVYADPPYDVQFTQYSKERFGWPEQVRLARWLAQHPGPVVISNQATPRILELYLELGYAIRLLQAPRRISRTGDRTPAREVLATRNV